MRARSFVPCAVVAAALAWGPGDAAAAGTVRCTARDGLQTSYRVISGPRSRVTCTSAYGALFRGILDHRPPSGWRCRQPADRAWPLVETCERRSAGRRVAVAELRATDDFFPR